MKLVLAICHMLLLATIIAGFSTASVPEDESISDEIPEQSNESNSLDTFSDEHASRVRRSCSCVRKSGECVGYGTYQCSSRRDAVVVQCIGNKWVRIGYCPKSCRVLSNNIPYCF